MVQWLGLGTFTAVAPGSVHGQGTKMPKCMMWPKMKITVDAHRAIYVSNVNSQSWELEGMEKVKHSPPHTQTHTHTLSLSLGEYKTLHPHTQHPPTHSRSAYASYIHTHTQGCTASYKGHNCHKLIATL